MLLWFFSFQREYYISSHRDVYLFWYHETDEEWYWMLNIILKWTRPWKNVRTRLQRRSMNRSEKYNACISLGIWNFTSLHACLYFFTKMFICNFSHCANVQFFIIICIYGFSFYLNGIFWFTTNWWYSYLGSMFDIIKMSF